MFKPQSHYSQDDLRQTMRDCIIRQEWEDHFAPPEGVAGRGGADPVTELKGFKRDADPMIIEPMLAKFPQGGSTMDIADGLTELAYEQKNASAGAFARNMALNIRDRIAPDYLETRAADAQPKASGSDIIQHLRDNAESPDSGQIIDNLAARLVDKGDITPEKVVDELKRIGDEYAHTGDDFLADEADIVRDEAKKRIAADTNNDQTKTLAQQWRAEERNWHNPLQDKLKQTTAPSAPKQAMAAKGLGR